MQRERGFTLVEMIVAVGLFAVVMVICVTALLSLVDANRKAQALQSVMNNLNIALDGMVRGVRMGSNYHCGQGGSYSAPADCPLGDTLLAFEPFHEGAGAVAPWLYWFAADQNGVGRLYKSEDGTLASGVPITAPEVSIDSVTFYVIGSLTSDNLQPKVLVVIRGTAGGSKVTVRTTFHIQATAVQRVLDL
ncbi:MAG TPA: type II secretion system protein [Candidatus Paceibacterota bacterium]|nr:type II secretion system protein [Candidatus Paceibacterota bacterium]